MSIHRIIANPADIGVGGYNWFTTAGTARFDPKRVEGALELFNGANVSFPHVSAGAEVWYHFRLAVGQTGGNINQDFLEVRDANSNEMAFLSIVSRTSFSASVVGATTVSSGLQSYAAETAYSIDVQVITGANIIVRAYINGALFADLTSPNTGTVKGNPASVTMRNDSGAGTLYLTEYIIANEDTRGMRVREMRPKAFGIYQEWDGSVANLRDTDLATGISVAVADRRVSFGITNVENVLPGDVINRVVCQSYGQRGETGLDSFNHFFRFRGGEVVDGADLPLSVVGGFHVEEFPLNPLTGVGWVPDDFRSLQSGVRSRA